MEHESKTTLLRKFFFSTLYISTFTFGGGFVIITFMKKKFVDELRWLDENEMLDFTALAQSCPGAIAVNAAILTGWRIAGLPGMIIGVLGTILPPMIILTIISYFYQAFATNIYVAMVLKGMQAGVAAVILDVVFKLGKDVIKLQRPFLWVIMTAAFLATFVFHINVIYIILTAALCGIMAELIKRASLKRKEKP